MRPFGLINSGFGWSLFFASTLVSKIEHSKRRLDSLVTFLWASKKCEENANAVVVYIDIGKGREQDA